VRFQCLIYLAHQSRASKFLSFCRWFWVATSFLHYHFQGISHFSATDYHYYCSAMDSDGGIQRKSYRLLSYFFVLLLLIGAFIIVNASMLHREIFLYKMRVLPSSVFSNTSNFSASTR
jgi:hypothetical protein